MHGFALAGVLLGNLVTVLARPELADIAALVLGLVFALSGAAKLRAPYAAAVAIAKFGVTAYPRIRLGALLGLIEVLLAVLLILDLTRVAALGAATGMLVLFAYAIARMLRKGESFPCFCFGVTDESISRRGLLRTASLGLLAGALLIGAPTSRSVGLADLALETTTAIAGVAVVLIFSQLPELVRIGQHRHGTGEA